MKHHSPGGNLFYRISKSALNSAMKNISYALSNKNLIIISLDPGSMYNGETAIGRGSRFPLVISTWTKALAALLNINK